MLLGASRLFGLLPLSILRDVDGIGDAVEGIQGQLEEALVIGAGGCQDASEITGGEASNTLPGDNLGARLGDKVVIRVAGLLGQRGAVVGDVLVALLGEALEDDIFELSAGGGAGAGDGLDMGRIVEDKGRAVAGAVDDEGDGEKVVAGDAGHGHGWRGHMIGPNGLDTVYRWARGAELIRTKACAVCLCLRCCILTGQASSNLMRLVAMARPMMAPVEIEMSEIET